MNPNPHQNTFIFNHITISSNFESGNLLSVTNTSLNQFHMEIGNDFNTNLKTWFYFSVEGIPLGTIVTFVITNMSNQGMMPVYKVNEGEWKVINVPMTANSVVHTFIIEVKVETGYQVTFKNNFNVPGKYYFAFSYPWTNTECHKHINALIENKSDDLFASYRPLCLSYENREVMLLTVTKRIKGEQLEFQTVDIEEMKGIASFEGRKGIFISARVHPGEVAASHIMTGIIESLFQNNEISSMLLSHCTFYIVPIINPDGVSRGAFRTNADGKNLNRYYSSPDPKTEPEIYNIKKFLLQMIKSQKIHFHLDLHAHVNKQGCFIYGNSTGSLLEQIKVVMFGKILGWNCEVFDIEGCNFSEKNMSSKDKGDELSKEGAARVSIFKETGLAECWTLECNYNSSKLISTLPPASFPSKTNNVSNTILCSKVLPEQKETHYILKLTDFYSIGNSILKSICDYYELSEKSNIFTSKLKNMQNFKLNVAIECLRLNPYKFDQESRKILEAINNGVKVTSYIEKLRFKIFNTPNFKNEQPHEKVEKYSSTKVISSTKMIGSTKIMGSLTKVNKISASNNSIGESKTDRLDKINPIKNSLQIGKLPPLSYKNKTVAIQKTLL